MTIQWHLYFPLPFLSSGGVTIVIHISDDEYFMAFTLFLSLGVVTIVIHISGDEYSMAFTFPLSFP